MPKIRIEYEVPADDCFICNLSYWKPGKLFCSLFNSIPKQRWEDRKFIRCQACIDATVKEG